MKKSTFFDFLNRYADDDYESFLAKAEEDFDYINWHGYCLTMAYTDAAAEYNAVRTGCDRASVTAVFDTSDMPDAAKRLIDDAGIECGDELIVHRVIGAQGKGKISINGVPASAATLRQVAEHLVDISSSSFSTRRATL